MAATNGVSTKENVFLIWGGEGWVAGHLKTLIEGQGKKVFTTTVRMENREAVIEELKKIKPTHVLNCAGCTGRPNADWCEDHKEETIRSNVIGTLNLADCCFLEKIHCTVFASGCIYKYDEKHPIGGPGYLETDKANFAESFYSETKAHVEEVMKIYSNVLILRLRMPVGDDLHSRNFVTKISKYERVVDVPNSNIILHDLLPASILMAEHKDTGIYNFTNPGAISHNEVLTLFKQYVRPDFTWNNFTLEEQAKVLKAGRSNCKLDTTKLVSKLKEYNFEVPEIHEAYAQCFQRMAKAGANGVANSGANGMTKPISQPQMTSSLIELAQTIKRETEKLEGYLKQSGSQMPGFGVDAPMDFPKLPEEIRRARQEVVRATKELRDLVVGPTEGIRWMAWDHNNSLSLHAIYHYGIAKSFPLNGTATYAEIAKTVGLDEMNLRRFIRHAMTNRIFEEVAPGVVAHTAASRVLAEDKPMDDWVGFCVEDLWPAASRTIDALIEAPTASEPTQTGFCVANNTVNVEPMFITMGRSPPRARRFGGALQSLTRGEGYEISYCIDNYDWEAVDRVGGTVVDIGGLHGFVCTALAARFPNMKFVVQDLLKMIATAPKLEGDFGERIKFQAHDFNTVQPVKGADVYFFRWILHNHSDKYSLNMLRQLIPALKKGAKIVINDHCLPEPGQVSSWDEKIIRTMDLIMLTSFNSQERTKDEFKTLFETADPGFKFLGVTRPEGCRMSIVEAVWEGEDCGGAAANGGSGKTLN